MEGGIAITLLLVAGVVLGGVAIFIYLTGGVVSLRSGKEGADEEEPRPRHKRSTTPAQEHTTFVGTRDRESYSS